MAICGKKVFLARIRKALGHPTEVFRQDDAAFKQTAVLSVENGPAGIRPPKTNSALLETLIAAGQRVNLNVGVYDSLSEIGLALARLVQTKAPEWGGPKRIAAWDHALIHALKLPQILAPQKIPVHFTRLKGCVPGHTADPIRSARQRLRRHIETAFIGVTAADFCLADTATLVMKTEPGRARAVSLLPSIHVAIIEEHQVVSDLKSFIAQIGANVAEMKAGLGNCLTLITGPSRTRDIEGVMVYGAHGPKEVYLYVLKNS
jgi:L-lactate dehydrogenase complex protein LldG